MLTVDARLFDATTMNEIDNHPLDYLLFWWKYHDKNKKFDWNTITGGNTHGHGH